MAAPFPSLVVPTLALFCGGVEVFSPFYGPPPPPQTDVFYAGQPVNLRPYSSMVGLTLSYFCFLESTSALFPPPTPFLALIPSRTLTWNSIIRAFLRVPFFSLGLRELFLFFFSRIPYERGPGRIWLKVTRPILCSKGSFYFSCVPNPRLKPDSYLFSFP